MDRYHIYEAIGRGKHSVVYKGRRKKTIQHYAINSACCAIEIASPRDLSGRETTF